MKVYLTLGLVFTFLILLIYYFTDIYTHISFVTLMILPGALFVASYLSFRVSRHYAETMKFSLSYIFLGIMFASFAITETVMFVFGMSEMEYLTPFDDIGYILFFVFGILFIYQQNKYYNIKSSTKSRFIVFLILTSIIAFTLLATVPETTEYDYDFYVSLFSIILSSVLFCASLLLFTTLRKSSRSKEYLLTTIAFGSFLVADLHYYLIRMVNDGFREIELFSYPFWFIHAAVFVYILYKLNKKPDLPV